MEITVVKEFVFDSAHYLPNYPGKCSEIHGHTYKLQVGLKGKIHPSTGMVEDFGRVKNAVDIRIIEELDHKFLNKINPYPNHPFPSDQPTAERMVLWIVEVIQSKLSQLTGKLSFVRLYETPTSYAEWRAEEC